MSDRGTCFTSEEFQEFLQVNNVKHIKVATASPQANGQVERINRDLGPMIAKMTDNEKNEPWYKILSDFEYAMNNTIHRSIGEYPSKMLFGLGQKGRSVDCVKENVIDNGIQCTDINVKEIRKRAEEVQKQT